MRLSELLLSIPKETWSQAVGENITEVKVVREQKAFSALDPQHLNVYVKYSTGSFCWTDVLPTNPIPELIVVCEEYRKYTIRKLKEMLADVEAKYGKKPQEK